MLQLESGSKLPSRNNEEPKLFYSPIRCGVETFSRETGVRCPYDTYISCSWFSGYMWSNYTWVLVRRLVEG